jgi:hypothetical protein
VVVEEETELSGVRDGLLVWQKESEKWLPGCKQTSRILRWITVGKT